MANESTVGYESSGTEENPLTDEQQMLLGQAGNKLAASSEPLSPPRDPAVIRQEIARLENQIADCATAINGWGDEYLEEGFYQDELGEDASLQESLRAAREELAAAEKGFVASTV
ncbi:MAG: hypothetical protein WAQ25_01150 [Candidatus Saccharimonas sp.]